MALSDRAKEWWRRKGYDTQAPNYDPEQAKEVSQYRLPHTSNMEAEAIAAEGVPNIPFTVYPTRTINPARPRTIAAGYNKDLQRLRMRFRPGASSQSPGGAVYDYYDVTPREWEAVRHAVSTGRFINSQLAAHEYTRLY